ncbi:hypothetical protein [Nostoc sp. KVJ3]|uniref:hypothetical protein n=1 Tax=Nostoc sp. KVJ3 TaxID=457945 RepID=UPI002237916A|nr:hypothetical protein [Nostoc sp. KVJ3]
MILNERSPSIMLCCQHWAVSDLWSIRGRSAIAYGKQYPEFWVGTSFDGQPATVGNGTHIGFIAPTKEAVHAFYEAALAAGGSIRWCPRWQTRLWRANK